MSRRIEANAILLSCDREWYVAELLHGLGVIPVDFVLRLPRSFIAAFDDGAVGATKRREHVLLGVAARHLLPGLDVTPIYPE